MRIDLVGPVPPPYGGISVHLERLAQRLAAAGHEARVIHPQAAPEKIWTAYRRIWRESTGGDGLHFHGAGWMHFFALGILAVLGRRVVVTIHGQSLHDELDRSGAFARGALCFGLRRAKAVIAVNEGIRETIVRRVGVAPERVRVIPAFLPPDRDVLLAQDPDDEVTTFLAAHDPVVSSNAFSLEDYRGVPLYGADLLPGLLAAIRGRHPRAGVLLYLATCGAGDLERLDSLRAAARRVGVEDHLCIVTGSRPFGPALVRSRVMVRPTVTDGDAVSVREALWLDVPVVATDCVQRPEGTVVVRTRDADALAKGVEAALDAVDPDAAPAPRKDDPFGQMLSVYRSLIGRRM